MAKKSTAKPTPPTATRSKLQKVLTGIQGLDDITTGGLPKNRPTLLVGSPGCGKTFMALEFIVNGIEKFNEPGVFMSFEEKPEELVMNSKSLGYDLGKHVAGNKLYLENVQLNEITTAQVGNYSIEGLFVRLEQAIKKVKAKRVVLDSVDALFAGLDLNIMRTEFKRLCWWLKEKKVTAVITGEAGDIFLSRNGLEEYVADCVIVLDNRVTDQVTTRRLRIVKYRGSTHGINEYPFVIDEAGVTVFPIIGEPLDQEISTKIISTGIKDLDNMLGEKGYYVGSSILISGTAGTGKTSIACVFAASVCKDKKQVLYCALEEPPRQVMRNMRSIGLELQPYIKQGYLHYYSSRPTIQNLELHFISIKKLIKEKKPSVIILDPITNLMSEGPNSGVRLMLTRFVDFLKRQHITVLFTAAITEKLIERNPSDEGISSMVDTWVMVQDVEAKAERQRTCAVLKTRGMANSKDIMNLNISKKGITLTAVSPKEIKEREEAKG